MPVVLTKTDYILFRECAKNVWYKIHKPEVWKTAELSDFEKAIIETGNEVELVARKLFPSGILIKGRGQSGREKTQELLEKKENVLFQPIFLKDGFLAAVDVLEYNQDDGAYNIYEIKSTTDVDKKTHHHDLAFQVNLLELSGLKIKKAHLIHLNTEYIRRGEPDIVKLFKIVDLTEEISQIKGSILQEMESAVKYLSQENEPAGYCSCVYKGRSSHCSTFAYSNSKVPAYGVHDIVRIGSSKGKLQELVDVGIFNLEDISEDFINKLSAPQKNQILSYVKNQVLIDKHKIKEELDSLVFPLHFLDYETFPAAIPRFDGFSPYQQIPFQYSLHILDSPDTQLRHAEFLFEKNENPTIEFAKSLQKNIEKNGSIIVWSKKFECKINEELAKRNPEFKEFIDGINLRVYDLMEIFGNQYYVHKDFKGRISIKNILPVLAPELSYKNLEIQEGGTASQKWNEAVFANSAEKEKIMLALKEYCKLDTKAMHSIWEHLVEIDG
ncbi:MAG: DUF2779 domain-containing protein [Patescibacteria group bacterium]